MTDTVLGGCLQQRNAQHFSQEAKAGTVKPHMQQLANLLAVVLPRTVSVDTTSTILLDVGCGGGAVSEQLAPHVRSCIGVDVAQGAIDVFNAKAPPKGNMRAICLDITDADSRAAAQAQGELPAQVDVAICHMTLHHVDDITALLSAIGQLLKPKIGKLVLTDLLATATSNQFHTAHAHHTVAHAGGFSKEAVQQLAADSGLSLLSFDEDSLMVRKAVEAPEGGGQASIRQFPVFLAVIERLNDDG